MTDQHPDPTAAVAAPVTRAQSAAELASLLQVSADTLARARAAGLIGAPDMKTPRWSAAAVAAILAAREQILAALPDDLDAEQMRDALGLERGAWRRGRDAGAIRGPDRGEYWTRASADALIARREQLAAAIPAQPLGAWRCAEHLAQLTGLPVADADVLELAERDLAHPVDEYKGYDLYDVDELTALAGDAPRRAVLEQLVEARLAWLADSMAPAEAAAALRWQKEDLTRIAAERGLVRGRFGRYARADILDLDTEELQEQVRREQLRGPDQAARHLKIRRHDFDHLTAAGWISPVRDAEMQISRHTTIQVPLYAVGDLEDAVTETAEEFGVDWEALRAVKPGQPSPLREYVRLPGKSKGHPRE